jgi:hypothetical protein
MRTQSKVILAYVAACLVIDLFPQYGPPHFRYKGSDPATTVWNFGWPLTLAIYDPRSGLHIGTIGCCLVPSAQLLVLLCATALAAVVRRSVSLARFSGRVRVYPGQNT